MKRLVYILALTSSAAFAQNNLNNIYVPAHSDHDSPLINPVQVQNDNTPPPQQTQINAIWPMDNVNNGTNGTNDNNNNKTHFVGNQFKKNANENTNDNTGNEDEEKVKNKNGKPYCKECEEIEKLKKQHIQEHYSSDAYGQKKRNHYAKHIRVKLYKKTKKLFGKSKKVKPNYSCFNW